MRIQLDTSEKTIKVEGTVPFKELIDTLKKLLPDKEWEKYTLESNTTIHNWSYPIYIEKWRDPYPWWNQNITLYKGTTSGAITSSAVNAAASYTDGGNLKAMEQRNVFNIEC